MVSFSQQNRTLPFASDFYRRRGYRKELRSEDHFYPFSSQKKSRFASDPLRRGRRSRRESLDFGALRCFTGCRPTGLQLLRSERELLTL